MNCNPIPEREEWFITDRKPTICPDAKRKKLKSQYLGCQVEKITMKQNIIFKVASQIFLVQELGVAVIVMRHFLKIHKKI